MYFCVFMLTSQCRRCRIAILFRVVRFRPGTPDLYRSAPVRRAVLLSLALPPVPGPRRTLHRREILALDSWPGTFQQPGLPSPSPVHGDSIARAPFPEFRLCRILGGLRGRASFPRRTIRSKSPRRFRAFHLAAPYSLAGYLSRRHCRRTDTGKEPNEALEHNGPCPVRFLRLECSDVLFLRSWF